MEFFTDTNLTGYGEEADNDLRVIRQIENRAAELYRQLWRLQARHDARLVKLEKNTGLDIGVQYNLSTFNS